MIFQYYTFCKNSNLIVSALLWLQVTIANWKINLTTIFYFSISICNAFAVGKNFEGAISIIILLETRTIHTHLKDNRKAIKVNSGFNL